MNVVGDTQSAKYSHLRLETWRGQMRLAAASRRLSVSLACTGAANVVRHWCGREHATVG
jgi:hypothetical protein